MTRWRPSHPWPCCVLLPLNRHRHHKVAASLVGPPPDSRLLVGSSMMVQVAKLCRSRSARGGGRGQSVKARQNSLRLPAKPFANAPPLPLCPHIYVVNHLDILESWIKMMHSESVFTTWLNPPDINFRCRSSCTGSNLPSPSSAWPCLLHTAPSLPRCSDANPAILLPPSNWVGKSLKTVQWTLAYFEKIVTLDPNKRRCSGEINVKNCRSCQLI